jgi:hypothetical protein
MARFDGGDDFLEILDAVDLKLDGDSTAFLVVKNVTAELYAGLLAKYTQGVASAYAWYLDGVAGKAPSVDRPWVQAGGSATTVVDDGECHVLTLRIEGGSFTFYLDGVADGGGSGLAAGTPGAQPLLIGFFNLVHTALDFGQLRLFNHALGTTEREDVEDSLIAKWGVGATAVPVSDSGAGSDAVAVEAATPASDIASAAEMLQVAAAVSLGDTGAGSDTVAVTIPAAVADAGSGAEAVAAASATPAADTGNGSDAPAIAVSVSVADTGAGVEAISAGVPIEVADAAAGVEGVTVTVNTPVADTAGGVDSVSVTVALAVSDSGAGVEASSVGAGVPAGDTGTGSETVGVAVALDVADAGAGISSTEVTGPGAGATLRSVEDIAVGVDAAAASGPPVPRGLHFRAPSAPAFGTAPGRYFTTPDSLRFPESIA